MLTTTVEMCSCVTQDDQDGQQMQFNKPLYQYK